MEKTDGTDPANFRVLRMEEIATMEDIVQADMFLYDIESVDGPMVSELARRSVGKYSNTVRLSRYLSHLCYVSNINALFEAYRCPSYGQFINRAGNLERQLTTCKRRVKHVPPINVYQLRESPFDKVDSFNIFYTNNQKLFKIMAVFDFESICVQVDKFCNNYTTIWIQFLAFQCLYQYYLNWL